MSKKLLLKGVYRRLVQAGIRFGNRQAATPGRKDAQLTFAQLHGDVVSTTIKLQRLPGACLNDMPSAVTYQQVETLRERLRAFTASLH